MGLTMNLNQHSLQQTQNRQQSQNQTHSHQTAESASLELQPATTKAGKTRQRMCWTTEMNEHIMRCYYKITDLETRTVGYRAELLPLFLQKYPQLSHLTEQRLADQKRMIQRNNRITQPRLEQIKSEVAKELRTIQNIEHQNSPQSSDTDTFTQDEAQEEPSNNDKQSGVPEEVAETDELCRKLKEQIEIGKISWIGTDPTKRHALPKLIYKTDTKKLIDTMNKIIKQYITYQNSLEYIHTIIYIAAASVLICNGQNPIKSPTSHHKDKCRISKPKWQGRIENKITKLRVDIGRLTQYSNGNSSRKLERHVKTITNNQTQNVIDKLDELKQKLAVYTSRLKRYKESNERKTTNFLFQTNEKKFYQTISDKQHIQETLPSKADITKFWEGIWANPVEHNDRAPWIEDEEKRQRNINEQDNVTITEDELKQIIAQTHNWKCPGSDNIQNFWYKKLTTTQTYIAKQINEIIKDPKKFPVFLTQGKTYIKPKDEDTLNPANYRPITCLPTLYKIITSCIANKIQSHLIGQNVITEEQKGCRKRSQGCKEQLIIDSIVMKQAELNQRNLTICYIDYKKAFDSVPHSWLLKTLEIYKVHPKIYNFLDNVMKTWRTSINLSSNSQTDNIEIKRGLFQGDSLSALWFCLCLNPLSNTLNSTKYGFDIKIEKETHYKISHLMYMDDIKLYTSSETQMKQLLKITENISKDIGMEFGMNKCKTLHIERGKWKNTLAKDTLNNEIMDTLKQTETYKYLGFQQNTKLSHTDIKKSLKDIYNSRLTSILKSKLNSRNLFKAINTFAIPILTYSFGVVKWSSTDLENINRHTRKLLFKNRMLHPNSCTERQTISRKEGGRGLVDVKQLHANQIKMLRKYFHNKDNKLHKTVVLADRNFTPSTLQG